MLTFIVLKILKVDVSTKEIVSELAIMSGSLESYVNRPVSVITADGRNFIGRYRKNGDARDFCDGSVRDGVLGAT